MNFIKVILVIKKYILNQLRGAYNSYFFHLRLQNRINICAKKWISIFSLECSDGRRRILNILESDYVNIYFYHLVFKNVPEICLNEIDLNETVTVNIRK